MWAVSQFLLVFEVYFTRVDIDLVPFTWSKSIDDEVIGFLVECTNNALVNRHEGKLLPKHLCSFSETSVILNLCHRSFVLQSLTVNVETHSCMKYWQ